MNDSVGSLEDMLENHQILTIARLILRLNLAVEKGSEAERKLHRLMEFKLSDKHYAIYKMIYVEHLPEEEVAKKMGYKSNEKGRKAGYKQLKNLKKIFIEKAKEVIDRKDIIL